MTYLYLDGESVKVLTESELGEEFVTPIYASSDIARLFMSLPVLYRCVDIRARAISGLPFTTQPEEAANYIRPLLYATEISLCLYGAAYWARLSPRSGRFRFLAAPSISPKYSSDAGIEYFTRTVGGREIRLRPRDLVYFFLPSATVEVGPGPAPAMVALTACQLDAGVLAYAASFFRRGTLTPVILSVEGYPNPQELERLQAWWQQMMSTGVRSAWTAIALRSDVKVQSITPPMERLGITELDSDARWHIAAALGVPLSLLSEPGNYATALAQRRSFYEETVLPEFSLIASTLEDQAGIEVYPHPEMLTVFRSAMVEASSALGALTSMGIITIDEAREFLGLPKLPKPAPVVQEEQEQGERTPSPSAQETVTPRREEWRSPNEERATPRPKSFVKEAALLDFRRWREKVRRSSKTEFVSDVLPQGLRDIVEKRLPKEGIKAFSFLKQFDHSEEEELFQEALDPVFEEFCPDEYSDIPEFDYVAFEQALFAALVAILARVALDGAMQHALEVGYDLDIDEIYPLILQWAREYARDLARQLVANTRNMLEGIPEGADWQQMLEPIFGDMRIERITVTETTRALSEGGFLFREYLERAGLKAKIVWITARDERVCHVCGALDGQGEDVWREEFPHGPPAHVHCRCNLRVVVT